MINLDVILPVVGKPPWFKLQQLKSNALNQTPYLNIYVIINTCIQTNLYFILILCFEGRKKIKNMIEIHKREKIRFSYRLLAK